MRKSRREGVGRKWKEENVLAFLTHSVRFARPFIPFASPSCSSRSRLRHLITCGVYFRLVLSSRLCVSSPVCVCRLAQGVSPMRLVLSRLVSCVSSSYLLIPVSFPVSLCISFLLPSAIPIVLLPSTTPPDLVVRHSVPIAVSCVPYESAIRLLSTITNEKNRRGNRDLSKTARMGIEQETSDEPHRFNETPTPIPTTRRSETSR